MRSTTLELRRSGRFSLKVRPRTRVRGLAARHCLGDAGGEVIAHAVVDATAGEDDLGLVAGGLGAGGEVVGIDADAVAADQAGAEVEEVPLGAGGVQHVVDGEAEAAEDHGHLVDEGDVEVALGVLDHLGGLGGADVRGDVDAAAGDLAVEGGEALGHLRRLAGDHLGDAVDAVGAVAGIDALGGVAEEEVDAGAAAGSRLDGGAADVLGDAGVDGALEHDDGRRPRRAAGQDRAQDAAGAVEGGEVGLVGGVDRSRDGDDVGVEVVEGLGVGGGGKGAGEGGLQLVGGDLAGAVVAAVQLGDAGGADVEADDLAQAAAGQGQGQRQADIAEADEADGLDGGGLGGHGGGHSGADTGSPVLRRRGPDCQRPGRSPVSITRGRRAVAIASASWAPYSGP